MAWTAKFVRFDPDSNVVQVEFTDGVKVVPRTMTVPPGLTSLSQAALWLKGQARSIIAALVSKDTVSQAVPDTDVTPDPDSPPDSDASLMAQWTTAVNDFRQAQKGVALGLFATNNAFYTTPQTSMMNIWNGATTAQKVKGMAIL